MEEEFSHQKSHSQKFSLNNSRSSNRSSFPENLPKPVDLETLNISDVFQKLLKKKSTDIQEKQKDYLNLLMTYKEEKIEAVVKRMVEDTFRVVNRNLIIANHCILPNFSKDSKNIKSTSNNPDMIVVELERKKQRLMDIFQILKDMQLIEKPLFQPIKNLVFEGIEKLSFGLKLREIQVLQSKQNNLNFSKYDYIVKNTLIKWSDIELLSQEDANNLGSFYTKIDNIEDFIFEVCKVCQEEIKKLNKNSNFDDLLTLMEYVINFLSIMENIRETYAGDYIRNLNGLWILREKAQSSKGACFLMDSIVNEFLGKLARVKGFLGNINDLYKEKLMILSESILRELNFEGKGQREKYSFDVYESMLKIGLIDQAFNLAFTNQENLILCKIYCLYNIGIEKIKDLMSKDDQFLIRFIDFYIAFWKYHLEENYENSQKHCKEFRLFLDFDSFQPTIEHYVKNKYPNLWWIILLTTSLENPDGHENIQAVLYKLISEETSVRMRKILTGYFKALFIIERNDIHVKYYNSLMSIDDIQIKYTKEEKGLPLIGIINEIKEGKFEKNIVTKKCLELLKNYLIMKNSNLNLYNPFNEDEEQLLNKVLKETMKMDKENIQILCEKLKEFNLKDVFVGKYEDKELHDLMTKMSLWNNFSDIREIAALMGKNDWQEAKTVFPLEEEKEDKRQYLEFILEYANIYFEHSNKI